MNLPKNQDTKKPVKIVFFGTSVFAVPALKLLILNNHHVAGVVTQPEKPVGRARVIMPSPVKTVALENKIPVLEPHNLKADEDFFHQFRHLTPDLCIVASYGKIIPEKILEIPEYGFLNIHPSPLPKYRGPSPIQTAIMNGDAETGVTIMKMDKDVDRGPVLSSKPYYLLPTTYYSLAEKELADLGAELLIDTLPDYIEGKLKPAEQNHSEATFTKILKREDGKIDWDQPAEKIYNLIRALNPEPGTWCLLNGKILNIRTAEHERNRASEAPGTVILHNGIPAVAASDGYIILKTLQLEGSKETDSKSFLNGHRAIIGTVLE